MRIINYQNISERVYEVLSERIINQKIKPGQRLKEEQLAQEMGVSRTPLRKTLSNLARDGFLEIEPHKGAKVRKFHAEDVGEVYDIRMALESLAARLAASKVASKDLEKLKVLFSKKDARTLIKADTQLHDLIIRNCGNKKLTKMLNNLHSLIQAFRIAGYVSMRRSVAATSDHMKILRALSMRDGEAAENLMRKHIARTKKEILRHFSSQEKEAVKK